MAGSEDSGEIWRGPVGACEGSGGIWRDLSISSTGSAPSSDQILTRSPRDPHESPTRSRREPHQIPTRPIPRDHPTRSIPRDHPHEIPTRSPRDPSHEIHPTRSIPRDPSHEIPQSSLCSPRSRQVPSASWLTSRAHQRQFAGEGVTDFPAQSNDPTCDRRACNVAKICEVMTAAAPVSTPHRT